jgi:hypothetical protein
VKNYNPKKISLIVGVRAISGFADGTFVEVDYDEDAFTKKGGADGQVTRVASANLSGSMTITLDQASDSNDYLSTLAIADRATGAGVVPVLLRDAGGTTIATGAEAWVRKQAGAAFSKGSEDRKWVIDIAELVMNTGGNANQA